MTSAKIRLRRVRFKDGRTLEVFHKREEANVNSAFNATVKRCSEANQDMVAFGLVAWNKSGYAFVSYEIADSSPLVAGQIPQLVKDVLAAEVAVRWSHE